MRGCRSRTKANLKGRVVGLPGRGWINQLQDRKPGGRPRGRLTGGSINWESLRIFSVIKVIFQVVAQRLICQ